MHIYIFISYFSNFHDLLAEEFLGRRQAYHEAPLFMHPHDLAAFNADIATLDVAISRFVDARIRLLQWRGDNTPGDRCQGADTRFAGRFPQIDSLLSNFKTKYWRSPCFGLSSRTALKTRALQRWTHTATGLLDSYIKCGKQPFVVPA
jgi:hypothetical protein